MSTFGVILLLVGFLVCGQAILSALGFVHNRADAARAAGMAVFAGSAATSLALTLLAMVGVSPSLLAAAVVWLLAALGAFLATRWRPVLWPVRRPLREASRLGRLVAAAGIVTLSTYLTLLFVRSWEPTGVFHPDMWRQWIPKAKILYFLGLDTGIGGLTSQYNPDYPLLQPISDALSFHALGSADPLDLPRVHWIVDASFLFATAWLLAPRVRPAILWPSLAMLAVMPRFGWLVGSLIADELTTMLIALAGVTALVWILDRDRRYVPLIMLFFAAATLTKPEGPLLSLIIIAALALTSDGRREWKLLGLLGVGVIGTRAIWQLWLGVHDVPRNPFYNPADFLDPGLMWRKGHRFEYGLTQLLDQLATPSRWLLIVPAALVLGLLLVRRLPTLGIFVWAVVVLDLLMFASVYWVGTVDLHFYVDNTVDRVPAFIVVLCGAVFPLLLHECLWPPNVTDPLPDGD